MENFADLSQKGPCSHGLLQHGDPFLLQGFQGTLFIQIAGQEEDPGLGPDGADFPPGIHPALVGHDPIQDNQVDAIMALFEFFKRFLPVYRFDDPVYRAGQDGLENLPNAWIIVRMEHCLVLSS